MAAIEKSDSIALVAEIDSRVVANSEVMAIERFGERSHVGALGIAVLKSDRGVGLGTTMMNSLIVLSKQAGSKAVILDVFATNTIARRLYEKVGFVVGKINKAIHRSGNYIDLTRMAIEI